jgi:hypothetical protein
MPSRQKVKGSNFERDIAKHLTKVFGLNFERVPTSGAMTGGVNAAKLAQMSANQQQLLEGDLIPPEELNLMKIECKTLKSLNFSSLYKSCSIFDDWIKQAESEGKLWFLIFKINNRGTYVATSARIYDDITETDENRMHYKGVKITLMDGFFEKNKDLILDWVKKYK